MPDTNVPHHAQPHTIFPHTTIPHHIPSTFYPLRIVPLHPPTPLQAKGGDAIAALSAALALATGTTSKPHHRSLIDFADGYVTMLATMHSQVASMYACNRFDVF